MTKLLKQAGSGIGQSLWLIEQAQRHPQQVTLLITASNEQSIDFTNEIAFFAPEIDVVHVPDWELLPYDRMMPSQHLTTQRLSALYRLSQLTTGIVIAPFSAWMRFLAPVNFIQSILSFQQHQKLSLQAFISKLDAIGYIHSQDVNEAGCYHHAGSLLTVWPVGKKHPLRLDFFDDQLDSIRQRHSDGWQSIEAFHSLPAREFSWQTEDKQRLMDYFQQQMPKAVRSVFYHQLQKNLLPSGIVHFLSLWQSQPTTLIDYLPSKTQINICFCANARSQMEKFWTDAHQRYQRLSFDPDVPWLAPAQVLTCPSEWLQQHQGAELPADTCPPNVDISIDTHHHQPYQRLIAFCQSHSKSLVLMCANLGRLQRLQQALQVANLSTQKLENAQQLAQCKQKIALIVAPIRRADWHATRPLIPDHFIFDYHEQQKTDVTSSTLQTVVGLELNNLAKDDLVVHIEHGVGRFQGLVSLCLASTEAEYVLLHYANDDKLYVPVNDLHKLTRFGMTSTHVAIDSLGKNRFSQAKKKAQARLYDTASELLAIAALRSAHPGHSYAPPDADDQSFAENFAYRETPCQLRAIADILADLCQPTPMDRLLCGDVGFGKTEVAMRAAFFVAKQHKQVVILVPTTLLAEQHYETFTNRFAGWPLEIACLTRLQTAREQKQRRERLQAGQVDIIIGTHLLLHQSIAFKDLGFLIIDEEHRFGVRDKEKIKKYRTEIDVLAMTATPIPRTLYLSYSDIRTLSMMVTAPKNRLPVLTKVGEMDELIIQEAVQREILRGGQIFYIHNHIHSLEATAQKLRACLSPQIKIQIAHGQMSARELEQVMQDFYHQRFQLLLSTTIIENGLDLPQVNTLFVDNAQQFGLAQLHQLRGRVGRSYHQAYAYFFTKPTMTATAQLRLHALCQHQQLGAGFALASEDLDIRGAGEMLGEAQSGHMHNIGLELYLHGLQQAVQQLKQHGSIGDDLWQNNPEISIDLGQAALIPAHYIAEPAQRLRYYQQLSRAESEVAFDEWLEQLAEKFGPLPAPVLHLYWQRQLYRLAKQLGICKMQYREHHLHCHFISKPNINHHALLQCLHQHKDIYSMTAANVLKINAQTFAAQPGAQLINALQKLMV